MDPFSPQPLRTYMITADASEPFVLGALERGLGHGVDFFQLRRPSATARALETFALECMDRLPGLRERLLVNDRLDVALAVGACGVHLPAKGLPVSAVRRRVPEGFRIGVSTHRAEEVRQAEREGASFVVFGPVFPTASKPGHPGVGVEALASAVRSSRIPVFALGGIGVELVASVLETGVAGIAGISMFHDERALSELSSRLERGSLE